ncbi:hydroxymethylglutaryl-CoA lyase [Burkholderia sp. L27(2015)]|uniref:hydroxymethylglutaryl-CoA lyase n=1 Tax=Burkholderia sp. L27(2015) TaxID=1641858 RepID=UPI00131E9F4B|nr:hydroxymethylglutaryl-CoA lyase [Burkholderia sp. L27(2015)]
MLFSPQGQRVFINDVAVRDGFQIEANFIPTEEKIRLIDQLSHTGLKKIEITSFVSPKAIPNLRDAEAVARGIERVAGVTYVALVPNERGAERALACGLDEANLVLSVSKTHNLANMRMEPAQSLQRFRNVMDLLAGSALKAHATIATAFGCPFEGAQSEQAVLSVATELREMGITSITLADTTGMAAPSRVYALTQAFIAAFPDVALTLHFHNTRGMGLANVMAGLQAGATSFDASLGGLGGCPFAPGATGNICTEDTVHMLQACGIDTGVDLARLLAVARQLPAIVGHDVPGQIIKAGTSQDTHPVPAGVLCA